MTTKLATRFGPIVAVVLAVVATAGFAMTSAGATPPTTPTDEFESVSGVSPPPVATDLEDPESGSEPVDAPLVTTVETSTSPADAEEPVSSSEPTVIDAVPDTVSMDEPGPDETVELAAAAVAGGSIAGTVTGFDGSPLDNVRVTLFRTDGRYRAWDAAFRPAGGAFSFVELPTGTYQLYVEDLDGLHYAELWQDPATGGPTITIDEGIEIAAGVQLSAPASISGTITTTNGSEYSGRIVVYRPDPARGWVTFGNYVFGSSSFRIAQIRAGTYRLCFEPGDGIHSPECWDNASTVDTATDLVLVEGAQVRVDVELSAGAAITGTVTDETGAPFAGYVYPYTYDAAASLWRREPVSFVRADSSGAYRIGGLRSGTYRICAEPFDGVHGLACWDGTTSVSTASDIAVAAGATVSGINLQVAVGGAIEGHIYGYPAGTQGAISLDMYLVTDEGFEYVTGDSIEPRWDPWPYRIGGLPSGKYRLCVTSVEYEFVPVFATECWADAPVLAAAADVPVTAGQTTPDIDVHLGRSGSISGNVQGPEEPVTVQLFTSGGHFVGERRTFNGRYRFAELPAGEYTLAFNRTEGSTRFAAQYYRGRDEGVGLAGATVITLAEGDSVTGVNARLREGGSITGIVVDGNDGGIAGCRIDAYTDDGSLVTRTARTDADGAFDVGGLATGGYRLVLVGGSCPSIGESLYFDSTTATALTSSPDRAEEVPVTQGAAAALPARLVVAEAIGNEQPTAIIHGPATAIEGETISLDGSASTDPDGQIAAFDWDLDIDGDFDDANSPAVELTLEDDGTLTVGLRVTDDGGATATSFHEIQVADAPPELTLGDDLMVSGTRVTRTGSFTDPGAADTHIATVDWGDGNEPEPLFLADHSFTLSHDYADDAAAIRGPGPAGWRTPRATLGPPFDVMVIVCDASGSPCGSATFSVTVTATTTSTTSATTSTTTSTSTTSTTPTTAPPPGSEPTSSIPTSSNAPTSAAVPPSSGPPMNAPAGPSGTLPRTGISTAAIALGVAFVAAGFALYPIGARARNRRTDTPAQELQAPRL